MGVERLVSMVKGLGQPKEMDVDDFCLKHGLGESARKILVGEFGERLDIDVCADLESHIVIFTDPNARKLYLQDLNFTDDSKTS